MEVTCTWGWLELPPQLPALELRLVLAEVLRGKGQAQSPAACRHKAAQGEGQSLLRVSLAKASGGPQTQIGTGRQTLA